MDNWEYCEYLWKKIMSHFHNKVFSNENSVKPRLSANIHAFAELIGENSSVGYLRENQPLQFCFEIHRFCFGRKQVYSEVPLNFYYNSFIRYHLRTLSSVSSQLTAKVRYGGLEKMESQHGTALSMKSRAPSTTYKKVVKFSDSMYHKCSKLCFDSD